MFKPLTFSLLLAAPTVFAADAQLPADAPVSELRARIERGTADVARNLSPQAQQAMRASLSRFYLWVDGYCGATAGSAAEPACVHNEYYNYLARIPRSVYRVGEWTVYDTGVYAALWPDGGPEALQGADLGRPFTWSLRVIWPRIDVASTVALGRPFGALSRVVHSMMADWVTGGWESDADVRLEALDACYVSASITASVYGGGAHPYSTSRVFNWNRLANRALENTDLFRVGTDWLAGIAGLYRQRLKALPDAAEYAATVDDQNLRTWVKGFVVTEKGLLIPGHEGRFHAESVPGVELPWGELASWLVPSARCSPRSTE